MKKLNVINENNFFYLDFFEIHSPTRHKKYKLINFAAINKSILANKLPSTNMMRFLRRIKSLLTR